MPECMCARDANVMPPFRAKYEVCAQPACDPSAASADADGCSVADAAAANAFCTEGLVTDCGVVTCSLGLLPAGSTGTGIEGSGCSLTPDPSSCTAGRPCQIATCSDLGECMYSPSDAFCLCAPHASYTRCTARCPMLLAVELMLHVYTLLTYTGWCHSALHISIHLI